MTEFSTTAAPMPYFDQQPFPFRPLPSQMPALPTQPPLNQGFALEDIFNASHTFENPDPFGSGRSNTPNSSTLVASPQIHPLPPAATTTAGIVRNAGLANSVQTHAQIRQAIRSFSKDFRLRGQVLTVESILSPLIYRSSALRHAVFANFMLQAEQATVTSPHLATQDIVSIHVHHYNTAITLLQSTLNNPNFTDTNIATYLALAFYDICAGDMEHWTTHIGDTARQIRLRGSTIDSHPLSLHTKFLCALYMRTDILGSNAVGQPANLDRELAQIAYSGIPISSKILLPYRIELELLLADISVFQYECSQLPPLATGWREPSLETRLRAKYQELVNRLQHWKGVESQLAMFEEAIGEYVLGSMLPTEMGLPLLCVICILWILMTNDRMTKNLCRCGVFIALLLYMFIVLRHDIISSRKSPWMNVARSPFYAAASSAARRSSTHPSPL